MIRGLKKRELYARFIEAMPKQKPKKTSRIFQAHKKSVFFGAFALLMAVTMLGAPFVKASVQDQINQLQAENISNRNQVAQLSEQAKSYEDAIKQLQGQIGQLQGKVTANEAEQRRLQQQIVDAEAELIKQKRVLGENIKAMYVEGEISTLEMLASSKNLSDFVDKQQYRNTVQEKIKATLDKITALKLQLKSQKDSIDALLVEQKNQQSQLADARNQQDQLLGYNQSQQADYNQKTKANQSKIDELIASQRRANFNPDGGYYFLRFPGPVQGFNPDNYPYRNAGFGMSAGGCVDNDGPDRWGYCTRQCVSFAAWTVEASGRSAPMYYGNARDWAAAAVARGIPVFRTPEPGDIAISTAGYWGHAMYVKSVSGNTFSTLEYNGNLTGQRSDNPSRRF